MLVIHWATQNRTVSVLANGIRPSFRRGKGKRGNPKGVYVHPYSRNKTLTGNWRRNLKTSDTKLGDYNGFVFKLVPDDFPLIAGYWFFNREAPEDHTVGSLSDVAKLYGDFFSGKILEMDAEGIGYNWEDFEIVIPRHIEARRILKVIRERQPRRRKPV